MHSVLSFRTALLAAALTIGAADQAFAHAHLSSSVPAENTVAATAPTVLQLNFSEAVNLKFSGVTLLGPDGKAVATSEPSLAAGDDSALIVPIPGALAPGKYTVTWRALSADGHKTQGAFVFTVRP
jgi:copper resistance protein C